MPGIAARPDARDVPDDKGLAARLAEVLTAVGEEPGGQVVSQSDLHILIVLMSFCRGLSEMTLSCCP